MKTASQVSKKWGERASGASGDYVTGAQNTSKDQAALAKEAIPRMKIALNKAIDNGSVARGLDASGKSGWLSGITIKGGNRYSEGVSSATAQAKYSTNSGKFDGARGASDGMPTGDKGSVMNLSKVAAVVNALRKQKMMA